MSRQTVSNVLNAPHLVRPETRERVQAAIDELGYRPSRAARQMRTGRSRLVAVRIEPTRDGINGSVLDRFLHALTETAAEAGYRVVLYTAGGDEHEIATYDELLAAYQLDGFVLTSTHHGDRAYAWLADHDVPFVTFGRPWGARRPAPLGRRRRRRRHRAGHPPLLAAGHERIGFIGWPEGRASATTGAPAGAAPWPRPASPTSACACHPATASTKARGPPRISSTGADHPPPSSAPATRSRSARRQPLRRLGRRRPGRRR